MRYLVLFCLLTLASCALSLAGNGKITGRVTDATTKDPLIGATVA
ncbi:MAG: carboxypeptidase-like regulatory domain-containing protein, partial [Ignavibacteria bacterium]